MAIEKGDGLHEPIALVGPFPSGAPAIFIDQAEAFMTRHLLSALLRERLTDGCAGVTSVCTAHPLVIGAALAPGNETGRRVLIEATCNQVNQEGGYTDMTPADFRQMVESGSKAQISIATCRAFRPLRSVDPRRRPHCAGSDRSVPAITAMATPPSSAFMAGASLRCRNSFESANTAMESLSIRFDATHSLATGTPPRHSRR
jgi:D-tagatose-1,6-bisphosphate aldolase subunit GatZ/KbaZ-like